MSSISKKCCCLFVEKEVGLIMLICMRERYRDVCEDTADELGFGVSQSRPHCKTPNPFKYVVILLCKCYYWLTYLCMSL